MSSMVERVARAIHAELDPPDRTADDYRAVARAAIAAMREPTQGMLLASQWSWAELGSFSDMWAAGIDAALEGE